MALNTLPNEGLTNRGYPSDRIVTPIIINGDMSVAQRGTSTSSVTATGYNACDRFKNVISGLGTWTVSQSTDVPTGQGFSHSLKMDCTTADASPAAGDFNTVAQIVEGANIQSLKKGTSSAESVTWSFWVKSNKTGTYICEILDGNNTRQISKSYTISSADTWEKKIISFPGDTSGAIGTTASDYLQFNWWLASGSDRSSGTLSTTWTSTTNANRAVGQVNLADSTSNEWYITGIQMEVGEFDSTSIPSFPFESYESNLRKCHRYYEMISDGRQDADGVIALGFVYQTNVVAISYQWVPKRGTPSISQASGTNYFRYQRDGGTEDFDSIKIYIPNANTGLIYSDDNFTGADDENGWVQVNSSSAYVALDAEL